MYIHNFKNRRAGSINSISVLQTLARDSVTFIYLFILTHGNKMQ